MHTKRRSTLFQSSRGHTLVELLVSMLLSTVALSIVARDFGYFVHSRSDMDLYAETQQAANSSMTFLSQELRQAGACLPELGNFIALEGEDNGTLDTLTVRIGIADDVSLECHRTILTSMAKKNESLMKVGSTEGFEPGQWIYIIRATGEANFFKIASINHPWMTIEGSFDLDYGTNSGVYAVEERVYQIEDMDGISTLAVAVDGGDFEPMVRGITAFDVKYKMAPCPPCDLVDFPSDDEQWRVVREVDISLTARSSLPQRGGEYLEIDHHATIKPRNFL